MAIFNMVGGKSEIITIPEWLHFTANTAGSTVKLNKSGSPTSITLEISKDYGNTWTTYTFGNTITLTNIGDTVYFRNTSTTDTGFSTGFNNYYYFSGSGSASVGGDVTYLLNKNATRTLSYFCFYYLFKYCSFITTAPKLVATTLNQYCYQSMFYGCSNLETLPILPAITLAAYCYQFMFYGCSKIKISSTKTGAYQTSYRIPTTGTGATATGATSAMLGNTGGTFTSDPSINTTYYTSNTVV